MLLKIWVSLENILFTINVAKTLNVHNIMANFVPILEKSLIFG